MLTFMEKGVKVVKEIIIFLLRFLNLPTML